METEIIKRTLNQFKKRETEFEAFLQEKGLKSSYDEKRKVFIIVFEKGKGLYTRKLAFEIDVHLEYYKVNASYIASLARKLKEVAWKFEIKNNKPTCTKNFTNEEDLYASLMNIRNGFDNHSYIRLITK
jgi:hypothetical protein